MKLGFLRPQPAGLRVWHWLNALVINGLLVTVLIRHFFYGVRSNAQWIEAKMTENGGPIDHKLAREIAKTMVDRFWNWHIFLGYSLGALLLIRIVLWIRSRQALALRAYRQYKVSRSGEDLYFFAVRGTYVIFYLAVTFMVASGLVMLYDDELGISSDLRKTVHEVHELFQWYFLAFVILHVGGVVVGELTKYRGIVSGMINGSSSPSDKR